MNKGYKKSVEKRRDYIGRINKAVDGGVYSKREASRISGVPIETICRYEGKGFVEVKLLPISLKQRRKLEDALTQEFFSREELLKYLDWGWEHTRRVARREGLGISLFDKRREGRWQSGVISECRGYVDDCLDMGVSLAEIARYLGCTRALVWRYKGYRK